MLPSTYRFVALSYGRLAQLVRAPALQAGGRRFESCTAHQNSCRMAPVVLAPMSGWSLIQVR